MRTVAVWSSPAVALAFLLVHSLGGNPVELRFVAQGLARAGYTVYCPLLPGLGGGTDALGTVVVARLVRCAREALTTSSAHCDVVLVGGISAGSMLALRLARERASRSTASCCSLRRFGRMAGRSRAISFSSSSLPRNGSRELFHFQQREPFGIKDERIRNFVIESFKSDDRPIEDLFGRGGGLVWEFKHLVHDVHRRFGEIKHPTLDHPSASTTTRATSRTPSRCSGSSVASSR